MSCYGCECWWCRLKAWAARLRQAIGRRCAKKRTPPTLAEVWSGELMNRIVDEQWRKAIEGAVLYSGCSAPPDTVITIPRAKKGERDG